MQVINRFVVCYVDKKRNIHTEYLLTEESAIKRSAELKIKGIEVNRYVETLKFNPNVSRTVHTL